MSREPVRLLDDPDAPLGLRDDLARARDAKTAYDADAGLARFAAAIQLAGPVAPPTTPPAAPSIAPAAGGLSLGAKGLLFGAGVIGLASIAGLWLASHRAPSPVAPPSSPVEAAPIVATAAPIDTSANVELPAPSASSDAPSRAIDREPEPSAARRSKPATSADDATSRLLAEEVAHLAALRAASGDPARALAMAEEGQRKFARGVFGQEREAIAIGALARLGRAGEARSRAEAFVARHPNSPLAEGVRRAAGL